MSVEIGPKACISVACGQTWQGHAFCLKKTQLVGSLEVPTLFYFYLYIYPPDSQESNEGANT